VQRFVTSGEIDDYSAGASGWSIAAFVALSIVAVLHVALYFWKSWWRKADESATAFVQFFTAPLSTMRAVHLLTAFVVLTIGYAMIAYVLVVDGVARPHNWANWLLVLATAVAAIITIALLVTLGHLARDLVRGGGTWVRERFGDTIKADPMAALGPLSAGAAAILGVLGLASGITYFAAQSSFDGLMAIAYFHRVTHPSNGVSPIVPLAFLLGAIYVWAFAHLWRLTRAPASQLDAALSAFDLLRLVDFVAARKRLATFLDEPAFQIRRDLAVAAFFVSACAVFVTLRTNFVSPEPQAFSWAFEAEWLCVQILLALAFAEALTLWVRFRDVIRPLSKSPLLGAFLRLSPALLRDRLSPRPTHSTDLEPAVRFSRQLGMQLKSMAAVLSAGDAADAQRNRYEELTSVLTAAAYPTPEEIQRGTIWTMTQSWATLRAATIELSSRIGEFWERRVRGSLLHGADFDLHTGEIADDVQRWYLRAEELVAMQFLFVVREMLARLANVFFYVVVGILLLVAAQQSFPFEPRQQLLGTAWVYVLVAIALIFGIIVQMERDPLLSAIASSDPGKVRWDATMWSKVLLYGVIPLATIFAAQFPQIGSTILDWLSPVQKAIP